MIKAFALLTTLGLVGVSVLAFNQGKELQDQKIKFSATIESLNQIKEENRRFKVVNSIYQGATTGLYETKPEITTQVNRVVEFILATNNPTEENFKECWDRKLKTTNWGSMGPEGLLDDCIDIISDSKTAIFMREIDNNRTSVSYKCHSEGNSHFEAAKNCWADRNYRMINSANDTLFDFVTTKNWMDNQKNLIRD